MMTISEARNIMRESGIKYARTYKIDHRNGDNEIVFKSAVTNKKCVVCDREDWYTGAYLK